MQSSKSPEEQLVDDVHEVEPDWGHFPTFSKAYHRELTALQDAQFMRVMDEVVNADPDL
jgi:hypothetical protein